MKIIDPGHVYLLSNGDEVTFIKREDGALVHGGTTNEELIAVLLDRMNYLDQQLACVENAQAIEGLAMALAALRQRTNRRTQQGVETTDTAHDSFEYLDVEDDDEYAI